MARAEGIGLGLLGMGTVGAGVAQVLQDKASVFKERVGKPLHIRRVLVRDRAKARQVRLPEGVLTTDAKAVLQDPTVHIVIEVMGGDEPAHTYIKEALARGKHVVTANKEVISKYGPSLTALARKNGVRLMYEASVGGGIPLIAPFQNDLIANNVKSVEAIINGTTNYILTRMAQEGLDFGAALKQAQDLGYAEPDPANDIQGTDAAYKLAILATLAFHTTVLPKDVYQEGISNLSAKDFRYARELGYAIKLLAIAKEEKQAVQARVHPAFVPLDWLLSKVDGVFNAVQVEGDLVGRVLFYGRGAGAMPTSSAIIADVINIAGDMVQGTGLRPDFRMDHGKRLLPMAEVVSRYYIRMSVKDQPGVLAKIATVLGDEQISIASVIQKETDARAQTAEIVIMTHPATEAHVQRALKRLTSLNVVGEIGNFIRVEG